MTKGKVRPVYNKERETKLRHRLAQMTELSRSIDREGTVTSLKCPYCIALKALPIVLSALRDEHTEVSEAIDAVYADNFDFRDNHQVKQMSDFLIKYGAEGYFCILAVNDGKRYKSEGEKFSHYLNDVGIDNFAEAVSRYVNVHIEQTNIENLDVLNPNATTSTTIYNDPSQPDVQALASAIAELLKQQFVSDSK